MPENHVFISYAHLDNQPLPKSEKGWVSYFDESLTIFLSEKIGREAKVWRDPQMARNSLFDKEIFNNLFQSLTLVSVVSPRYLNSDYCRKEFEEYINKNPPIGARSPVFKVVKTFLKLEEMPEMFREIIGFNFYIIDKDTKIPRDLGLEFGDSLKQEFFLRVSDLAYEIAEFLKVANVSPAQIPVLKTAVTEPITPKTATIYLARTSSDFQIEHDNIRRDLLERGYRVLPPIDAVEPRKTEEYKNFVRDNMRQSSLSVHLIGKNYGERPEDGEQSYIHLQSIVAAERDREANFSRIVWLPKDIYTSQPRHEEFVKEIWNSCSDGVEVLQKPLEEVKTTILDVLNRRPKPLSRSTMTNLKPSILVLYDKSDADSAAKIEAQIKERGFSLRSVAKYLSGDPGELVKAQNDYLLSCDSVLIYWKDSRETWVWSMLRQLQKIFGDGREDDFLGQAVFVDGGNNAEDFMDETEADFITDSTELDDYLERVKTAFQADRGGQK